MKHNTVKFAFMNTCVCIYEHITCVCVVYARNTNKASFEEFIQEQKTSKTNEIRCLQE